jgi:NADP-dependent 3-hydroxy acid dehydrogenase YdfG
MPNVNGKVIIITGASSCIGAASAKLLAKNGAKILLGVRRTAKLEQIVTAIRQEGGIAEFKAVDVTDREELIGVLMSHLK